MRRLPLWVTLVTGWYLVLDYFVPHPAVSRFAASIHEWVPIVAAVALCLGALSLFRHHFDRIRERHPDRLYSVVTLVAMTVTVAAGLSGDLGAAGSAFATRGAAVYDWIYESAFVPLRATMFSLLAFYLASAAVRAFRIRSPMAALMFLSGFLVMLGNVPFVGEWWPFVPRAAAWVMDVPMTAAMRAIKIGVGLGLVVMSLRILLGKERSYLGSNS